MTTVSPTSCDAGSIERLSVEWEPPPRLGCATAPVNPVNEVKTAPLTVIIEERRLVRDCLVWCLQDPHNPANVSAFATLEGWLATNPDLSVPPIILISAGEQKISDLRSKWAALFKSLGTTPQVVLLADSEDAVTILDALNGGVKGYIPTSVPLCVAMEAIHLVRVGGVFIPTNCLLKELQGGRADGTAGPNTSAKPRMFTGRQGAVIEAIRRGKSNKLIAYELAMAESTVKVHVRNIMRKLKAHNRTEVVFLLSQMEDTPFAQH